MTDLDADAIVGAAFLLATLALVSPLQTAATALTGSAVGLFDLKRVGRLFVINIIVHRRFGSFR